MLRVALYSLVVGVWFVCRVMCVVVCCVLFYVVCCCRRVSVDFVYV